VTRLALLAGQGDRLAFENLVRATQADVWRFCAHAVDRQAADDLTQDTYLRVLKALPRFRNEASGRTFVLSIARRACVDEIRRRTRRRALHDAYRNQRRAAPTAVDPSARADLDAIVADLPTDRREAFVLTQLLGLSYEAAAEVCGCAVGTIRSRVARARDDLVEAMEVDVGPDTRSV
jgi:RNA polymerase sigma-70 factor (ECF subfamily)